MTFYAVALVLPDEIEKELDRLRNEYRKHIVYIPVAHITLVFPFVPTVEIDEVIQKLRQVAHRTTPFTLELKGVNYFEGKNNVAYIVVINKQPVIDLHRHIIISLEGLRKDEFKDEQGDFNLDRYMPHVTIGELIPDEILPELKICLSKRIIACETKITFFSLFGKNQDGQ